MKTFKRGFISIYFCFSIILFAQTEWSTITLPCPGGIPNSLYMNRKTEDIYAGCYGGIWKLNQTTNQWSLVDGGVQDSSILANAKITAMYLDNAGVFYAGCDSNTPSYISYNGGKTWRQIIDINFTLLIVNCITEGHDGSVYLGTNRNILKTTDHGKTWISLENSPTFVYDFTIDSHGNIWAATNGGVYKSNDSGLTWVRKSAGMLGLMMTSIEIDSKGIMWVGADGDVYRSDDNGENWNSTRRKQMYGHIYDLAIDKNDVVYIACAVNIGYIDYTIDKGNTWIEIPYLTNSGSAKQLFANSKLELYTRHELRDVRRWVYGDTQVLNFDTIPKSFSLEQNYPNPFNPTTTISYMLPTFSKVRLSVCDLLGREVAVLVNEEKSPGNYEIKFDGTNLASGVYFYKLSTGRNIITKKMVLVK